MFAGDITEVHESDIPDHDVPARQAFPASLSALQGALSKKKMRWEELMGLKNKTQGTLFFDVARIIKEKAASRPFCWRT